MPNSFQAIYVSREFFTRNLPQSIERCSRQMAVYDLCDTEIRFRKLTSDDRTDTDNGLVEPRS